MYLTGFADEAASDLAGQIRATKELGWRHIEARNVDGVNIHDMDPAAFEQLCEQLEAADIAVNCFGSTIANWSKQVTDHFDDTLAEVRRAIPRMQRLKVKRIRVMSYAVRDGDTDQMESERFRRLREINAMFADAGIQAVHENCKNYGGMSWQHTLRLIENVPGLKLVYDTGNPVGCRDYSATDADAVQDSWTFYKNVRDHVVYVHIKDAAVDPATGNTVFTYPGEGQGSVKRIVRDLMQNGYDDGISIEPHLAVVYHDASITASDEVRFANYVEYGRRMEKLIAELRI